LPTGPFEVVLLALGALEVRVLALALLPLDALPPLDVLDEPFRLVGLLELELVRRERVLEDRVVWAIFLASLGFRASCAVRAGGGDRLPADLSV